MVRWIKLPWFLPHVSSDLQQVFEPQETWILVGEIHGVFDGRWQAMFFRRDIEVIADKPTAFGGGLVVPVAESFEFVSEGIAPTDSPLLAGEMAFLRLADVLTESAGDGVGHFAGVIPAIHKPDC